MRMRPREGFALPVAIFVIGFLTVGVAAAFTRVDNESRVNRDRDAELDAYSIAQSGLEYYMTNRRQLGMTDYPPAAAESARVNVPGGYADVILHRLRPKNLTGTLDAMYYVRSRGTARRGSASATPIAQRTVTQITVFHETDLQVTSAWTSLSGLLKNGNSGTVSGIDNCGVKSTVAGVAVPTGMWDSNGNFVPTGSPPVLEMGTKPQMSNAIKIDWNEIVNNNAIYPDITLPGGTWPSFADPDYWPAIRIDGNYSIPTDGRGILIVTGDLVITGSKQWQGVVLVGGTITADGNNTVEGAVISGLNEKLGKNVPESAIGNGTKTYVYDSCNVSKAMSRVTVLRPVPGTWSDNFVW